MVHSVGRHQWIDDAVSSGIAPAGFAHVPEPCGDSECGEKQRSKSQRLGGNGLTQPPFYAKPIQQKQKRSGHGQDNVRIQPIPEMMRRTDPDQSQAEKCAGSKKSPTNTSENGSGPK